jgi:hypothetical protein
MGKIIDWFVESTNKNWRHGGCVLRDLRRARDQGILFIEAAFLLPLAVAFLLGVVEVGNWYYQGLRLGNLAQNLATGVQQDPSISPHNLYRLTVSTSSLPEVKKTGGTVPVDCSPQSCEIKGLTRKVKAFKAPPSHDSVQSASSSDWSNPWVKDTDPSNDRNVYYLGVSVSYPRRTLFSKIFPSTSVITRWSSVVVNPSIQPRVTTEVRFFKFNVYGDDTLEQFGGYKQVQIGTETVYEDIGAGQKLTPSNGMPFTTDVVKTNHGGQQWGIRCRQEQGWILGACSLADGIGSGGDKDLVITRDGCISDNEEKGQEARIHIQCIKTTVD